VQLAWPVPRELQYGLPSDIATSVAVSELMALAGNGLGAAGSLTISLVPVTWTLDDFALVRVPFATLVIDLSDDKTGAPSLSVAGQLPSVASQGFRALLSRLFATSLLLPEPPQRSGLPVLDSFSAQAVFAELSGAVNNSLILAENSAGIWTQALCAPRHVIGANVTFPTCAASLDAAGVLRLNLAIRVDLAVSVGDVLQRLLMSSIAGAVSVGVLPEGTAASVEDTLTDLRLSEASALQRLDLKFALALGLAGSADSVTAGRATFELSSLSLSTRVAVHGTGVTLGPVRFENLGASVTATATVEPPGDTSAAAIAARQTTLRVLNSKLATNLLEIFLGQEATFDGRVRLAASIAAADGLLPITLPDINAVLTYTDNALFDGMPGAVSADFNLDTSALETLLQGPAVFLSQLVGESGVGGAFGLPGVLDGVASLLYLPVAEITAEVFAFSGLAQNGSTGQAFSALEQVFGTSGDDSGGVENSLLAALARLLQAADASFHGAVLLTTPLRLVDVNGTTLLWTAGLGQEVATALSLSAVMASTCLSSPGEGLDEIAELRCLLQAALPPLPGVTAALGYAWQRLRAGVEGLLGSGASSFAGISSGALGATNPNLAGVSLETSVSGTLGSGRVGLGDVALVYNSTTAEVVVSLRVAGRVCSDAAAAALSAVELARGAASDILSAAGSSSFVGNSLDPDSGGALGTLSTLDVPGSPIVILTSTVDFTMRVSVPLGTGTGTTGLVPTLTLQNFEATLALDAKLTEPLGATFGSGGVTVELDDVSLSVSGGIAFQDTRSNLTKYASVDAQATLRLTGTGLPDIPEVLLTLADEDLLDEAPLVLTLDLLLDSDTLDLIVEGLTAVERVNNFVFDNDEMTLVLPLLKTRLIDLLNLQPSETEPNVVLPDVDGATAVPPSPPPPPPTSGLPGLLALATPAEAYRDVCGDACTARGLAGALRTHIHASINSTVVPAIPGRNPLCLLAGLTDDGCVWSRLRRHV
jgi:hypothetical protein